MPETRSNTEVIIPLTMIVVDTKTTVNNKKILSQRDQKTYLYKFNQQLKI